jgi:site-specific DNA-methyltransferase (adenine-specific)
VAHYFNYDLMKALNGGKQMTDVWPLPAIGAWEKSCGKHPTQKPLSLLSRIIQASTVPGAWVLDPFSGSGTTGIAASLLGRGYLGLELESQFLEMARARRMELDTPGVRRDYLSRLAKAHVVPDAESLSFVADAGVEEYGVPWLE